MDKQKQRLINIAPTCTEIEIVGMVQDPEDDMCICNAESVELEPTSWDVLVRYNADEVGNWDTDDCSFNDYDSAYNFACELVILAPAIDLYDLQVV